MSPAKQTVSTKIPNDDRERLEKYAEERDITQSDAMRRLLHDALDRAEEEGDWARADLGATPMQLLQLALLVITTVTVLGGI